MSYCKVILLGNLTRDVEMRYTPKGIAVAQFDVATNRKWKSESGEDKEEVCFTPVTAWNKQAEAIAKYLHKGDPILLEGRLTLEQWDDKQTGQKRSKLKVVLETFSFVGSKRDNSNDSSAPAGRGAVTTARDLARGQQGSADGAKSDALPAVEDEDAPF